MKAEEERIIDLVDVIAEPDSPPLATREGGRQGPVPGPSYADIQGQELERLVREEVERLIRKVVEENVQKMIREIMIKEVEKAIERELANLKKA